jgi:hypothetical protein
MSLWLDTTGKDSLGVGVCDRCKMKMPISDMVSDPNSPGLMMHAHCVDEFDPYRLPARQPDPIILKYVRPDIVLTTAAVVIGTPTGNPNTDPWPWPGPPYVTPDT